jgi:hypothetical protein
MINFEPHVGITTTSGLIIGLAVVNRHRIRQESLHKICPRETFTFSGQWVQIAIMYFMNRILTRRKGELR